MKSPLSLQTEQSQLLQLLPIRPVLQTPHQLCCPSLNMLQGLNVFLVAKDPKLDTVLEVWPHQCSVQRNNYFPAPAGNTVSDASQDAICLLGHLGTLLAHVQLSIDQYPQVCFLHTVLQPLCLKPCSVAWSCCGQSAGLGTWFC